MKRWAKILILPLLLLSLAAATGAWYINRQDASTASFRIATVKRGDLLATISATGTVEPEEVVDVGAQVAGQINSFGKDKNGKTIDYGSVVDEGMVLANIDDSLYAADAAQGSAQLEQAKASVQRAQADLGQMKAKLVQAQADWERAEKLGPSDALAQSSYDAYRAGYETAKANVAVGETAIAQAQGAVLQAEAAYQRAKRNLDYCTIKSPVKGVIIDRRVNIGQTVVSSLNAPSLFLIAKDLTRMEVWVAVNEADIGSIHPGQPASFSVDAYPGQTFRGEVGKVRLNATMTQNVVTYTVEVVTDNFNGKLLPYLTANVQFEVSRRTNVLLVPNAALRWYPQPEQVAPEFRDTLANPTGRGGNRTEDRAGQASPATQTSDRGRGSGTLWVRQGNYVQPVKVRAGLSDGLMTEVQGEKLAEGTEIVVGEQQPQQADAPANTNPFTPQLPGRHR